MRHKILDMKKTLIILALVLAVLATGCKKEEKSKSLSFNGRIPYVMALRDTTALPVASEYDVTVTSSNTNVVRPYAGSVVIAWNVGVTTLAISNGYESITVPVEVELFIEPTFEFGCNPSYIRALYGAPYTAFYDNGILRYIYTAYNGYSWACGQMDFLFEDGEYIESQVYINPRVETRLNNYINENFNAYDTIMVYNPIIEDSVVCHVYTNKLDPTVRMGKYPSGDEWDEIFLFYIQELPTKKFDASSLKMRPRSSKFLY